MNDGSITSLGKMYIFLICLLGLISVNTFFIQLNQANEYKQFVNYQIERHGGLTPAALKKLNEHHKKHYGSEFKIESPVLNQKVSFGDEVDYTIQADYEILYFKIPNVKIPIKGSAVAWTR
ncbi:MULTISPECIES: hypothetical protein [Bacillus]|uniref:hypothetical protein n=1 Tax=Bacillus TaxID=1386 RepID=UPI000BA7E481|nr:MULTISPECIES: hypothetical protein [Bacillus]PAK32387.1 hypothetical protein CHI04_19235 [Bacillus safensis]PRO39482.1 hypothetical protein C6W18_19480 [Bacillus sp. LLTC93]